MKYTELTPHVKWNCPSYNNRNVLIICHPQQIPYYISQVRDFVWEKFTNVTMWQINQKIDDMDQLFKEINQMDAIICFITELLVSTSNIVGDTLIPSIIEKKYCFLPIIDDENLGNILDQKYGHIHFVKNKEKRKICFDVIEGFIKNLFLSKKRTQWFELSYANDEAFSHSYFISYRKADGKYIDYLQRRIHEDQSFVDTQLWYDSYLVPGENYDENLINIIKKSSAVLLLITPHLLEQENYVLRIEIPFAKACGKTVIGILMEETDLQAIHDLYGVEKIYKLEEWTSFTQIICDAGIPIPDMDSYPHHLFELAIAYMEGSNVERNMKIARELLYQATIYKYMPAYEKLIEISTGEYEEQQYYNESVKTASFLEDCLNEIEDSSKMEDDGDKWIMRLVKLKTGNEHSTYNESYKDIDEAVRLFEEYIKILKERYETNPTERCFVQLLDYLRKYGEFYLNLNRLNEAIKHLFVFYKYVEPLEKKEPNKLFTYLSVASLLLAKTFFALEDYAMAEKYYRKSVDIDRVLNDDNDCTNPITYINLLTSLCELGYFYQKRDKLLKAKIMYQEVLQTIQNNATFYTNDWDADVVYKGYADETTAKKTEELENFARISLWEIEVAFLKMKKFKPTIKVYSRALITDPRILKNCDGDEIQLLSHEIMINSIAKIQWLTDYLSKSEWEFDICQNKYCIDAKNLMAVMTLDINDVCQLVVHTTDIERATEVLQEIVAKLND